jgi:hypothetical protein
MGSGQKTLQGSRCLATTAPPAARIAHFKMIAMRVFGSNHCTAANRKAPMIMIAKIKRTTNMAVPSPPPVSTPHGSGEYDQRANHDHHNCELKKLTELHIRPDTALPPSANRR